MHRWIQSFEQRSLVALGRLLKEVENQTEVGLEILQHTSAKKGNAHVVGITGPPGAGKSTLVGKLCKVWAKQGVEVGIVCVDPTSPFSGGALLGDRVRMQELAQYPNVFIKSLATRGSLGGVTATTADIIQLMDSFGKELIVVETVGVGQIEFDVLDLSDTVVLVNVPGLGDSLQTVKAGIVEIADVFVINQADRPGADESVRDLKMMVGESGERGWAPPVLKTIATSGDGIVELLEAIHAHQTYLKTSGQWRKKRQERNWKRFRNMLEHLLAGAIDKCTKESKEWVALADEIRNGRKDPIAAAREVFAQVFRFGD
ncbi:methylmalonyl Co-A mutase-associated GTPase MeaB [Brevibacillus marinus]|uniref:methylmalonyl Co-A mutase-associated GTPase MeaB n=1 Tax=Brevibacillus marinus TaxID=2496837 RepID=UPI000F82D280|nr:methylmalonyl Co-A mutase-associated GTPase MeaB [Brevibacillus marinus]